LSTTTPLEVIPASVMPLFYVLAFKVKQSVVNVSLFSEGNQTVE